MKFEEALVLLKSGKKIKRRFWLENHFIKLSKSSILQFNNHAYTLTNNDLLADDWEEFFKREKKTCYVEIYQDRSGKEYIGALHTTKRTQDGLDRFGVCRWAEVVIEVAV